MALIVKGMTTIVQFQLMMCLKWLITVIATGTKWWSFDLGVVDRLELRDLIVDDHFISEYIDVGIFRVSDQGTPERMKDKLLNKHIFVLAYELWYLGDWNIITHVN